MTTPAPHAARLSDKDADYWRERLQKIGFTEQQADRLVQVEGADLHRVEDLVTKRGCPHDVAFDIAS